MKIPIKGFSVIYLALLLLLGSNLALAEQEGKDTDPKLLCSYFEVVHKGRPPFKRRTVIRECAEQENLDHTMEDSSVALNERQRNYGHPTTRKR